MKLYSWHGVMARSKYGADVIAVMASSYTAALRKATAAVVEHFRYDDDARVAAIARLQLQPPRMTSTVVLSYYE